MARKWRSSRQAAYRLFLFVLQLPQANNSVDEKLLAFVRQAEQNFTRRLETNGHLKAAFGRLSARNESASLCSMDLASIAQISTARQRAAGRRLCSGDDDSFAMDDGDPIRCASATTPLACVVSLRSTFIKTKIDNKIEIYGRKEATFLRQGGGVGCLTI